MDDSERPPVLAHQRFAADRASFAGLGLRERFERIHATKLWGAATSVSGLGSELPAIAALAEGLLPLLREHRRRHRAGDRRWPAPVALLDGRCDEAGGGCRDKSLGVWRLDSL